MNSARLIVTTKCVLNCDLCCNKHESVIKSMKVLPSIDSLLKYDVVSITGGEPTIEAQTVIRLVEYLREKKPEMKLYLYTLSAYGFWDFSSMFDGVTFSLHEEQRKHLGFYWNGSFSEAILKTKKIFDRYRRIKGKPQISIKVWMESSLLDVMQDDFDRIQEAGIPIKAGEMLPDGACPSPEDDLFLLLPVTNGLDLIGGLK